MLEEILFSSLGVIDVNERVAELQAVGFREQDIKSYMRNMNPKILRLRNEV